MKQTWRKLKRLFGHSRIQYVVIATAIIFTIVTAVAWTSYHTSKNLLQSQISEPQNQILRIGMQSVNEYIDAVNDTSVQIIVNKRLSEYIRNPEVETYQIIHLTEYLDTLVNNSEIITDIFIYNNSQRSVVANTPHGFVSSLVVGPYLPWLDQDFTFDNQHYELRQISAHSKFGEQNQLVLLREIKLNRETIGRIAIRLDTSKLFDRIFPDYVSDVKSNRYIWDSNQRLLFASAVIDEQIPGIDEVLRAIDNEPFGEYQIQGERYLISQITSDVTGWTFYSVVPQNQLLASSISMRNVILFISLLTLLTGSAAIFLLSRILYQPVKRLIKGLRKYDNKMEKVDIEQLEKYTLKLLQDRDLRLLQNKQELKLKFIQDLILGLIRSHEVDKKWEEWFADIKEKQIIVGVLSIDRYSDFESERTDEDMYLFKYAIRNIVEETLKDQGVDCITIEHRSETIGMLIIGSHFPANDFQQISDNLMRTLHLSVTIGLSDPFKDPKLIHDQFQSALRVANNRLFDGYGKVFFDQSDAERTGEAISTQIVEIGNGLFEGMRNLRYEAAQDGFDQWLNLFKQEEHDPKEVISLIKQCIYLVPKHPSNQESCGYRIMGKAFRANTMTLSEIRLELLEDIKHYYSTVDSKKNQEQSELAEQIRLFITNNYHRDLGLQHIAETFGLSVSFISSLFKQEQGTTIYEYLTHFRIENSVSLLLHTEDRIVDIAEKVGYQNETSFIRAFRKLKNVSPGRYRQIMKSAKRSDTVEMKEFSDGLMMTGRAIPK